VVDILGVLISRARDLGLVEGFSVGKEKTHITHLQFVVDTLLFSSNDKDKFLNLITILKIFQICSGLKVNLGKSDLVGVNLGQEEGTELANLVGCRHEELPIKYLGLPLGGNPKTTSFWNPWWIKFIKELIIGSLIFSLKAEDQCLYSQSRIEDTDHSAV